MRAPAVLFAAALALGLAGAHAAPGAPAPPGAAPAPAAQAVPMDDAVDFGSFGKVALYRPQGTPRDIVLFLSGDGGWNLGVVGMAQALRDRGALVAGIDTPRYLRALDAAGSHCSYPAADFETFSHWLQSREKLATYRYPVLVGYSSGATLAYALLAQSPSGTFAGGLSLGFCPDLEVDKPLCETNELRLARRKGRGFDLGQVAALRDPWIALQGEADQVCEPNATAAFVSAIGNAKVVMLPKVGHGFSVGKNWLPQYLAAWDRLAAAPQNSLPPAPKDLGDLPVVEVPAHSGSSDALAILVTGDGGWAGLDQDVAAALAARGVPVVALNSLKYFWTPRDPQAVADDVDRIARYYLHAWGKRRVVLVGYSMGADVLPFALNRLGADVRARVASAAVIGMGAKAVFEFKVANWLADPGDGLPTVPEVERLHGLKLTCIYGDEEDDALCPRLAGAGVRSVELPGGHHYNGDYQAVAKAVLEGL